MLPSSCGESLGRKGRERFRPARVPRGTESPAQSSESGCKGEAQPPGTPGTAPLRKQVPGTSALKGPSAEFEWLQGVIPPTNAELTAACSTEPVLVGGCKPLTPSGLTCSTGNQEQFRLPQVVASAFHGGEAGLSTTG